MTQVVVVGAGPAGLEAGLAAARNGADVTVLDATDDVGGQFWRHLPAERAGAAEAALHHGWADFGRLRAELTAHSTLRLLTNAQLWSVERGPTLHVLVGPVDGTARQALTLRPEALILTTGAHDRTLPFPGWDLPGVFTGGAAQALAKRERVAVGRRVLVAGAGPFLLPVASSLVHAGATVVGVLEASRGRQLASWSTRPWELAGAAGKTRELAGYAATFARHRIPYRTGRAVVSAHGAEAVEAVTVATLDADWRARPGTDRIVAVDAVCVTHGFTPRLELAIAAGCALTNSSTNDRFVVVDEGQRTSVPSVFAAGEITGIGGADLARAEGAIAGHIAAGGSLTDRTVRTSLAERRTYTAFARRIAAAHSIKPGWRSWLTDDTLVCRCEEVTLGTLRATAGATASNSLRSLRLTTRAGLGACQARICGRTVEDLLGVRHNSPDAASTDHRPIAAPIRLAELAEPTAKPKDPS